jgi:hypothetical protein
MRDIRELRDDAEAYAAELQERWGGLLSYRYVGRKHGSMNTGPTDDTVTLRHDLRDRTGGILLSVLAIAAPEGGGVTDLEAVPNPVIHSCHILDPGRDVARIEVRSEQLKQGRQMAYSRSLIVDADQPSRVLAITEGQGAIIGIPPEGLDKMDVEPIEVIDSPDLPPLWSVFGGTRREDGHWALGELSIELATPDAALHLGPQVVILEAAATDLASELAGTDRLAGVSAHTMFLARGKAGPFRVDGEAFVGTDGTVAARVTLHDEGAGDRAVTAASYMFHTRKEDSDG